MYLRAIHAEFDISALRTFIRENPLGLLISAISSPNFPTIQCTHIPWILDLQDEESPTELGIIRGHLARANPHSKALIEAITNNPDRNGILEDEVTVVFNGPAHSYVTPKYYVETKPATGKVVPTWNYSAVQVYGRATIFADSSSTSATSSFLDSQITALTQHAERSIMQHIGGAKPEPWKVADAPVRYTEVLKKSIIGIEIRVERLEGKWKMSQELTKGDREGVIEGFAAKGDENGAKVAETVRERGEKKVEKAKSTDAVR